RAGGPVAYTTAGHTNIQPAQRWACAWADRAGGAGKGGRLNRLVAGPDSPAPLAGPVGAAAGPWPAARACSSWRGAHAGGDAGDRLDCANRDAGGGGDAGAVALHRRGRRWYCAVAALAPQRRPGGRPRLVAARSRPGLALGGGADAVAG